MKLFILIPLLLNGLTAISQINQFINFSGNYSIIQDYKAYSSDMLANEMYFLYDSKPGFNFSYGIKKDIGKKMAIKAGAGISMLNFKKRIKTDESSTMDIDMVRDYYLMIENNQIENTEIIDYKVYGNKVYSIEYKGNTQIYYFSVPLQFSYELISNRICIIAGLSPSFILISRQYIPESTQNDEMTLYTSDGLNNTVVYSNIDIEARIYKNLWLKTGIQHSFSCIYDDIEGRFLVPKYKGSEYSENVISKYAFANLLEVGFVYYLKGLE